MELFWRDWDSKTKCKLCSQTFYYADYINGKLAYVNQIIYKDWDISKNTSLSFVESFQFEEFVSSLNSKYNASSVKNSGT